MPDMNHCQSFACPFPCLLCFFTFLQVYNSYHNSYIQCKLGVKCFSAHVTQPISYCYLEQDVDDDDEEGEGNVEEQPDLDGLDGCSWRPALQV